MRTRLHGGFGYLVASLVLTYALASLSFYLYEAPINKLKRFFRGGADSRTPAVSAALATS